MLIRIYFVLCLSMALTGCSILAKNERVTTVEDKAGKVTSVVDQDRYWWRVGFKHSWPEGQDPDFAIDLLIAHAIVAPALDKYQELIPYWRFHRRAARDKTGHQFTFLMYTEKHHAQQIFSDIKQNQMLRDALFQGAIEKISMTSVVSNELTDIEDTSDKAWSEDMQKHWPAFIMGVSSLWLGLIAEQISEDDKHLMSFSDTVERYREAEAEVTRIWRKEGQHALFHHINAIFGYEPLIIKKLLTF